MSSPFRLIPLGGFGEIGKNMLLLELEEQLLLVDSGIAFPDDEVSLGADLLIPNFSYLRENAHRLAGIVLTHGHEDHIGGLPFVLQELQAPLYGSLLTLGLVRGKLREHKVPEPPMTRIRRGERIVVGPFDLEFIRVNHSIPDSLALAIRTPVGLVVHSGDFKFDHTPIDGEVTDFAAFARLGDEGVRLLISDSTNIEKPGHTPSEAVVGDAFERIFQRAPGRILVATFASQIHRIQQVFDVAAMFGRKVCVAGRSMERNVGIASELGYLRVPDGCRVSSKQLDDLPDQGVVVLVTGAQGEPVSGLCRLAQGTHPKLRIHPEDTVIVSATPIPGNEATVWKMVNDLMRGGAQVVDYRHEMVHVSGHASREETKLLFNLIRPEFAVPYHGEYRQMISYGELAQDLGLSHMNVFLLQNGDVLRLDENGVTLEDPIQHGTWTIDGRQVNELGTSDAVIQDRVYLAESGVITGALVWDFAAGELAAEPAVGVRGVRVRPGGAEAECLAGARDRVAERLAQLDGPARRSRAEVERAAKRALRGWFEKETGTFPVLQLLVVGVNEAPHAEPEPEPEPEHHRANELVVDGAVEVPMALRWADLVELAAEGESEVALADLLERVQPAAGAARVEVSLGGDQAATGLTFAELAGAVLRWPAGSAGPTLVSGGAELDGVTRLTVATG
ncbi:MAG: ribonuclease J [Armatimonadetes bacterium]|nr:ribonuclease J [Armatimonadota bacterium]